MSYSGKSKTAADEDWVGELLVNVATLTSIGMFRFALRWPDIASLLTVFAVTGVLRLALDVRADRGVRGGRMGVAAGLAGLVRAADRQAGRRFSAHVSGVSAAVDTLKPSWGRLGRVRDLQRRRESCRFARSVGRDRRRGKGQNGAEQGQIARRRARCVSTEGRPRPRNPRSWARCAATVVVMAALPGLASVGDCKRTLNYE